MTTCQLSPTPLTLNTDFEMMRIIAFILATSICDQGMQSPISLGRLSGLIKPF